MKKLYLQFIWHMHQPYYKEPGSDTYLLPWVFLHGIKDYLEMPRYYELYNIKGTFNFVPSLLKQLRDYSDEDVKDWLIGLIKRDVITLAETEKLLLIPSLFMANVKNMIAVSERYKGLYDKYKSGVVNDFSHQEVLDLEVHFLLAWTGHFIRNESSFIRSLIVKDRDFSEDEKIALLKVLFGKIKYLFEYYKKLHESGRIEVSMTPYYHPIFPLLLDIRSAKESKKDIALPQNYVSLRDDAFWHLKQGVEEFEKFFHTKPFGVWPAEGSVSSEALEIFGENFSWCATDEDVLANSLGIDLRNKNNRSMLYKRYIYGNRGLSIFFRDKLLSDLLGFSYANMNAVDAACDFIRRLKDIYDMCDFEPVVSVIMDGENAWEFYKNNANDFFSSLYERVMKIDWINTVTPSEFIQKNFSVSGKLENVVAGSWIYGNFTTWVGHPEKNKGWEYLFKVKNDMNNVAAKIFNKDKLEMAMEHFRIAEGSDWFWWYGDDHFTSQWGTFDYLFRCNLMEAYRILGMNVPSFLLEPIKKGSTQRVISPPKNFIYPKIDGKIDSYFEYLGASVVNLKYDMSSMNTGNNALNTLKWGFDDHKFYMLVPVDSFFFKNDDFFIEVKITCPKDYFIKYFVKKGYYETNIPKDLVDCKFEEVFECSIDFSLLETKRLGVVFSIMEGDNVIDRAPVYAPLELKIDTLNFREWIV